MGMLVEGVWRALRAFRDRVRHSERGRYRLYVSESCPWAHRTLIARALKGREKARAMPYADPYMADHSWRFPDGFLYELYARAKPKYTGRVTVPVLWDEKENASSTTNRPRSSGC